MCNDWLGCSAFKYEASNGECQLGSKFDIDTVIGPADERSQVHVLDDNEGKINTDNSLLLPLSIRKVH